MKTNIAIELNDEQRLNLAQKYNDTKNKKLLTRSELNDIVQNYVLALIDTDGCLKENTEDMVKGAWDKIYYHNGRKISEAQYNSIPEGPRKFYGF